MDRERFLGVFQQLKAELLGEDKLFSCTPDSKAWMEKAHPSFFSAYIAIPVSSPSLPHIPSISFQLFPIPLPVSPPRPSLSPCKLNRGLSVVDTVGILKGYFLVVDDIMDSSKRFACPELPTTTPLPSPPPPPPPEPCPPLPLASPLQLQAYFLVLQAYFLVVDDIMDSSITAEASVLVGMIAINDGVLLNSHIFLILRRHFSSHPAYTRLLDLFNEVRGSSPPPTFPSEAPQSCVATSPPTLPTPTHLLPRGTYVRVDAPRDIPDSVCQMLDLITTPEGEVDLNKYTMSTYLKIVQYKTGLLLFLSP
ncbi:unnamed protein product, partial [Closterium sp. NIES-64]